MKTLLNRIVENQKCRLIASFGSARLVITAAGKTELRGGTPTDQADAREWISMFMHEAVPTIVNREA